MRGALLDACRFDWSNISPAIFGALFQSVMDPVERRAQGTHYTTEKNILKVIEPLFMDDLRAEFERVRKRRGRGRLAALRQFQAKLLEPVEFATLEWVHWFNNRRLLEGIGNRPPAEAEAAYYRQVEHTALAA